MRKDRIFAVFLGNVGSRLADGLRPIGRACVGCVVPTHHPRKITDGSCGESGGGPAPHGFASPRDIWTTRKLLCYGFLGPDLQR